MPLVFLQMYSQIFYWTLVIHLQMRVLVLPKVVVSLRGYAYYCITIAGKYEWS